MRCISACIDVTTAIDRPRMSSRLVCVDDYEQEARLRLDRNAWNYYSSGADEQQTLRDNVEAFLRYRLRPRMLRDTNNTDTSTTVLGHRINFPVAVAPTAFHCMAHHDGESGTARACSAVSTCMTLSTWSTTSIEDVAAANGDGLRWFQLYIYRDKNLTYQLVKRAEQSSYKALVLTVDTPELGKRREDVRHNFNIPAHLNMANFKGLIQSSMPSKEKVAGSGLLNYTKALISPSVTWESVDWLRSVTSLPIVLKGILTREDATIALQHNVQGILVSNHGARQLDEVQATLDALSEVVEAVQGKMEVYLDGGVRKGTDVLKALALGARAVFVGRPVLWGLACKGEEGVREVLLLLKEEFHRAMVLSGCSNVSSITRELVVHQPYCKL